MPYGLFKWPDCVFISASWNLLNEWFLFFFVWGQTCVFLLDRCRNVFLASCQLPVILFVVSACGGRCHYPLVIGEFILRSDMPFAKFYGLRVCGRDFHWRFKLSLEVKLSKLPQRIRNIQMINHETANCLSSYLCMTSSQDCQILHVQIWEDFNA